MPAILLEDDSAQGRSRKDSDIASALDLAAKVASAEASLKSIRSSNGLDTLMADIQKTSPVVDEVRPPWKTFLSAKIDDTEAISHLLNALDTSFRYTCYAQQEAKTTELDDLATRKKTWEKAEAFCRHDQRIRAAYRYSQLQVKKDGPVGELKEKLRSPARSSITLAT